MQTENLVFKPLTKGPEISELEADKYSVQIWAHNSKKQKR